MKDTLMRRFTRSLSLGNAKDLVSFSGQAGNNSKSPQSRRECAMQQELEGNENLTYGNIPSTAAPSREKKGK